MTEEWGLFSQSFYSKQLTGKIDVNLLSENHWMRKSLLKINPKLCYRISLERKRDYNAFFFSSLCGIRCWNKCNLCPNEVNIGIPVAWFPVSNDQHLFSTILAEWGYKISTAFYIIILTFLLCFVSLILLPFFSQVLIWIKGESLWPQWL